MKGLIPGALGSAGVRRRQVEAPGAAAALPDAGGREALRPPAAAAAGHCALSWHRWVVIFTFLLKTFPSTCERWWWGFFHGFLTLPYSSAQIRKREMRHAWENHTAVPKPSGFFPPEFYFVCVLFLVELIYKKRRWSLCPPALLTPPSITPCTWNRPVWKIDLSLAVSLRQDLKPP